MASPDKNNHSDIMLDFSDLNLSIDSTKGMSHPTPSFTQDENINYSNLFDQSVNDSQATVLDTSLNTTLTGFVSDADQSDSSFSLSSGLSLFRDLHWPVSPIAQRPVSSPEIVSPLDDADDREDGLFEYSRSTENTISLMSSSAAARVLLDIADDSIDSLNTTKSDLDEVRKSFSPLTRAAIQQREKSIDDNQDTHLKRSFLQVEIDETTEESESVDSLSDHSSKRSRPNPQDENKEINRLAFTC